MLWSERQRFTQAAWEAVRRHPRYWLMGRLLPLLGFLAAGLSTFGLVLGMSPLIYLLIDLTFLVLLVTEFFWHRRHFREALRQKLLDGGVRSAFCFECGYELEGYEGKKCPACDAPLLRQTDSPPGNIVGCILKEMRERRPWPRLALAALLQFAQVIEKGYDMPDIIAGFVKNGVVVPNAHLPEGAFVEVHVIHGPIEAPPELQEEFDAWDRASADAMELVERLAQEGETSC